MVVRRCPLEDVVTEMESFWKHKRVLVTGHTGFKGSWLVAWLSRLGADLVGVSLPAATQPNLYNCAAIGELVESHYCDIRDVEALASVVRDVEPDIVFHLAAQALVRASYKSPIETFSTNTLGTASVMEAIRHVSSVRVVVVVTTDKVYQNFEHNYPYRETDQLGGYDPYSASKAASEIVVSSYRDSFLANQGTAVASARAGNVIGGGDWSEDRLIPDAVRAWSDNASLEIRMPQAIRPWQHVLEPLYGYMTLAQRLWSEPELAAAYNFGPLSHEALTVRDVTQLAKSQWGDDAKVVYQSSSDELHEASWLSLDVSKVRFCLGIEPKWSAEEAVKRSIHWYKSYYKGATARSLCNSDIDAYESCL